MSEERFREIFRRITSETPDAPDFADLEVTEARPSTPLTFKPWMAAVGTALLVMVVVGAFGLLGGGGSDLASPSISTTTTPEPQNPIPADCPVTIPTEEFVPPDTHPQTPSGSPGMVWYGTNGLWTSLSRSGDYQPRKSVWWSANFPGGGEESEPALSVTFELLNSEIPFVISSDRSTNAQTAEDGWFIIANGDPEIRGCWRATAIYKGASLSYVYYNSYFDDPSLTIPDVIGETVSQARNILESHGYVAAFLDSSNLTYEVCAQEPGAGEEIDLGAIIGMRTAAPGGCEELMNPVLTHALNPDYLTYQDEFGRTWYATACPNADVLVLGGVYAADGLPKKGQTGGAGDGVVAGEGLVVRNGEAWDRNEAGEVVVEQVEDFMLEVILGDEEPCPSAPSFTSELPVAYIRESGPGGLCPENEPDPLPSRVIVLFDCGGSDRPNLIRVTRPLQPGADRITSTFQHLVAGPTSNERARGFGSFFGDDTIAALISAELSGDRLVVNFNDHVPSNNVSTATGRLFFIAELYASAFQSREVDSVEFEINGSCEDFWNLFVSAGTCTTTSRAGWEDLRDSWENG